MRAVTLLVPGELSTPTGGYVYDRRIAAGLRALDWSVEVRTLDAGFPFPSAAAREHARRMLASLSDGTLALIDGLALGALPELAEAEAARLRLIALVHHPLAAETGLAPATAAALAASERRALRAVRHVVVTSRATAAGLDAYEVPRERIEVIVPGTDPVPPAGGSGGADLRLLCVGSLVPRKGHELLLEALAPLAGERWRLECIGSLTRDPHTVQRLRARIEALGLGERVQLLGELDAPTLAAHYRSADAFVLATLYEGFGMAVAEALARGLPVVSTETGAIAELVGSDAGLLVPPGDVAALRAALRRLLGDAPLRAALSAGALRARERLPRWPDACARMAAVLERIAGGVRA